VDDHLGVTVREMAQVVRITREEDAAAEGHRTTPS